jgi:uncharacterized integral membrane protein
MRRIVTLVILVPLAAIAVLFSVANRGAVVVSLDPFHSAAPALTFTVPLFVLLFGALALGVLIGGVAAWSRQGRWRRATRRIEAEAAELRDALEKARHAPPAPGAPQQLPAARDAA